MSTSQPQTQPSLKQSPGLVTVTEAALTQVKKLLTEEQAAKPDITGLRLAVTGGGCSGFSYKLEFDASRDNDYLVPVEGINIYVDPKSAIYLKGIQLDYQGGLEGKGFVFQNPNATSTCGCGESFSV